FNILRKKKSLGQHFLKDDDVCYRIANLLTYSSENPILIEVGPGEGVLTKHLLELEWDLKLIEKDDRLPKLLIKKYPKLKGNIIHEDVLKVDWRNLSDQKYSVIGNYPYNISSQILFKVLENRDLVVQMAGMFQKEVAQRICAKPSTKQYGVLTVLTHLYYKTEYCFDVPAHAFDPPPKVVSGVMKMERHHEYEGQVEYEGFRKLVKTAFLHRRKKLSNTLSVYNFNWSELKDGFADKRADHLSVEDYITLYKHIK
ncbi:UNVERIFIED_CONTAM: hypothetical protein GTU68_018092, partial [Idotea baltica]|nr:hypothetical protein [Idotea baltica]